MLTCHYEGLDSDFFHGFHIVERDDHLSPASVFQLAGLSQPGEVFWTCYFGHDKATSSSRRRSPSNEHNVDSPAQSALVGDCFVLGYLFASTSSVCSPPTVVSTPPLLCYQIVSNLPFSAAPIDARYCKPREGRPTSHATGLTDSLHGFHHRLSLMTSNELWDPGEAAEPDSLRAFNPVVEAAWPAEWSVRHQRFFCGYHLNSDPFHGHRQLGDQPYLFDTIDWGPEEPAFCRAVLRGPPPPRCWFCGFYNVCPWPSTISHCDPAALCRSPESPSIDQGPSVVAKRPTHPPRSSSLAARVPRADPKQPDWQRDETASAKTPASLSMTDLPLRTDSLPGAGAIIWTPFNHRKVRPWQRNGALVIQRLAKPTLNLAVIPC